MQKLLLLLLSLFFFVIIPPSTLAAEFRAGESLIIPQNQTLANPYLAGSRINLASPVTNDLVAAGGDLTITGEIGGSILAAGGNMQIRGPVAGSIRVAGGTIDISGSVTQDVIAFGGTIHLSPPASISGDVVLGGGQVSVEVPIDGDLYVYGGDVALNSHIQGNVQGEMGTLSLGPNASISGDLSYSSPEKATISEGASIAGETKFTLRQPQEQAKQAQRALISGGFIYKLIADILFTLLLIVLLPVVLTRITQSSEKHPFKNLLIGFAVMFLFPVASLIALLVLWLGVSMWLFYLLTLIVALGVAKMLVGWKVLTWWEGRNEKKYILDWKAAIVGPILIALVGLIPVLGWLAIFIVYLLALGSLSTVIYTFITEQRPKKTLKK